MAWIETVPADKATGSLATIYQAALQRAGRVAGVLRLQSINPPVLRASVAAYQEIMKGPSPLSRAQREMIAVVVSRANNCHY